MNKLLTAFTVLILCSAVTSLTSLAATKPPVQGGMLPPFELVAPEDSAARTYLGLLEGGSFTISQIKARVVIIQLFSMY